MHQTKRRTTDGVTRTQPPRKQRRLQVYGRRARIMAPVLRRSASNFDVHREKDKQCAASSSVNTPLKISLAGSVVRDAQMHTSRCAHASQVNLSGHRRRPSSRKKHKKCRPNADRRQQLRHRGKPEHTCCKTPQQTRAVETQLRECDEVWMDSQELRAVMEARETPNAACSCGDDVSCWRHEQRPQQLSQHAPALERRGPQKSCTDTGSEEEQGQQRLMASTTGECMGRVSNSRYMSQATETSPLLTFFYGECHACGRSRELDQCEWLGLRLERLLHWDEVMESPFEQKTGEWKKLVPDYLSERKPRRRLCRGDAVVSLLSTRTEAGEQSKAGSSKKTQATNRVEESVRNHQRASESERSGRKGEGDTRIMEPAHIPRETRRVNTTLLTEQQHQKRASFNCDIMISMLRAVAALPEGRPRGTCRIREQLKALHFLRLEKGARQLSELTRHKGSECCLCKQEQQQQQCLEQHKQAPEVQLDRQRAVTRLSVSLHSHDSTRHTGGRRKVMFNDELSLLQRALLLFHSNTSTRPLARTEVAMLHTNKVTPPLLKQPSPPRDSLCTRAERDDVLQERGAHAALIHSIECGAAVAVRKALAKKGLTVTGSGLPLLSIPFGPNSGMQRGSSNASVEADDDWWERLGWTVYVLRSSPETAPARKGHVSCVTPQEGGSGTGSSSGLPVINLSSLEEETIETEISAFSRSASSGAAHYCTATRSALAAAVAVDASRLPASGHPGHAQAESRLSATLSTATSPSQACQKLDGYHPLGPMRDNNELNVVGVSTVPSAHKRCAAADPCLQVGEECGHTTAKPSGGSARESCETLRQILPTRRNTMYFSRHHTACAVSKRNVSATRTRRACEELQAVVSASSMRILELQRHPLVCRLCGRLTLPESRRGSVEAHLLHLLKRHRNLIALWALLLHVHSVSSTVRRLFVKVISWVLREEKQQPQGGRRASKAVAADIVSAGGGHLVKRCLRLSTAHDQQSICMSDCENVSTKSSSLAERLQKAALQRLLYPSPTKTVAACFRIVYRALLLQTMTAWRIRQLLQLLQQQMKLHRDRSSMHTVHGRQQCIAQMERLYENVKAAKPPSNIVLLPTLVSVHRSGAARSEPSSRQQQRLMAPESRFGLIAAAAQDEQEATGDAPELQQEVVCWTPLCFLKCLKEGGLSHAHEQLHQFLQARHAAACSPVGSVPRVPTCDPLADTLCTVSTGREFPSFLHQGSSRHPHLSRDVKCAGKNNELHGLVFQAAGLCKEEFEVSSVPESNAMRRGPPKRHLSKRVPTAAPYECDDSDVGYDMMVTSLQDDFPATASCRTTKRVSSKETIEIVENTELPAVSHPSCLDSKVLASSGETAGLAGGSCLLFPALPSPYDTARTTLPTGTPDAAVRLPILLDSLPTVSAPSQSARHYLLHYVQALASSRFLHPCILGSAFSEGSAYPGCWRLSSGGSELSPQPLVHESCRQRFAPGLSSHMTTSSDAAPDDRTAGHVCIAAAIEVPERTVALWPDSSPAVEPFRSKPHVLGALTVNATVGANTFLANDRWPLLADGYLARDACSMTGGPAKSLHTTNSCSWEHECEKAVQLLPSEEHGRGPSCLKGNKIVAHYCRKPGTCNKWFGTELATSALVWHTAVRSEEFTRKRMMDREENTDNGSSTCGLQTQGPTKKQRTLRRENGNGASSGVPHHLNGGRSYYNSAVLCKGLEQELRHLVKNPVAVHAVQADNFHNIPYPPSVSRDPLCVTVVPHDTNLPVTEVRKARGKGGDSDGFIEHSRAVNVASRQSMPLDASITRYSWYEAFSLVPQILVSPSCRPPHGDLLTIEVSYQQLLSKGEQTGCSCRGSSNGIRDNERTRVCTDRPDKPRGVGGHPLFRQFHLVVLQPRIRAVGALASQKYTSTTATGVYSSKKQLNSCVQGDATCAQGSSAMTPRLKVEAVRVTEVRHTASVAGDGVHIDALAEKGAQLHSRLISGDRGIESLLQPVSVCCASFLITWTPALLGAGGAVERRPRTAAPAVHTGLADPPCVAPKKFRKKAVITLRSGNAGILTSGIATCAQKTSSHRHRGRAAISGSLDKEKGALDKVDDSSCAAQKRADPPASQVADHRSVRSSNFTGRRRRTEELVNDAASRLAADSTVRFAGDLGSSDAGAMVGSPSSFLSFIKTCQSDSSHGCLVEVGCCSTLSTGASLQYPSKCQCPLPGAQAAVVAAVLYGQYVFLFAEFAALLAIPTEVSDGIERALLHGQRDQAPHQKCWRAPATDEATASVDVQHRASPGTIFDVQSNFLPDFEGRHCTSKTALLRLVLHQLRCPWVAEQIAGGHYSSFLMETSCTECRELLQPLLLRSRLREVLRRGTAQLLETDGRTPESAAARAACAAFGRRAVDMNTGGDGAATEASCANQALFPAKPSCAVVTVIRRLAVGVLSNVLFTFFKFLEAQTTEKPPQWQQDMIVCKPLDRGHASVSFRTSGRPLCTSAGTDNEDFSHVTVQVRQKYDTVVSGGHRHISAAALCAEGERRVPPRTKPPGTHQERPSSLPQKGEGLEKPSANHRECNTVGPPTAKKKSRASQKCVCACRDLVKMNGNSVSTATLRGSGLQRLAQRDVSNNFHHFRGTTCCRGQSSAQYLGMHRSYVGSAKLRSSSSEGPRCLMSWPRQCAGVFEEKEVALRKSTMCSCRGEPRLRQPADDKTTEADALITVTATRTDGSYWGGTAQLTQDGGGHSHFTERGRPARMGDTFREIVVSNDSIAPVTRSCGMKHGLSGRGRGMAASCLSPHDQAEDCASRSNTCCNSGDRRHIATFEGPFATSCFCAGAHECPQHQTCPTTVSSASTSDTGAKERMMNITSQVNDTETGIETPPCTLANVVVPVCPATLEECVRFGGFVRLCDDVRTGLHLQVTPFLAHIRRGVPLFIRHQLQRSGIRQSVLADSFQTSGVAGGGAAGPLPHVPAAAAFRTRPLASAASESGRRSARLTTSVSRATQAGVSISLASGASRELDINRSTSRRHVNKHVGSLGGANAKHGLPAYSPAECGGDKVRGIQISTGSSDKSRRQHQYSWYEDGQQTAGDSRNETRSCQGEEAKPRDVVAESWETSTVTAASAGTADLVQKSRIDLFAWDLFLENGIRLAHHYSGVQTGESESVRHVESPPHGSKRRQDSVVLHPGCDQSCLEAWLFLNTRKSSYASTKTTVDTRKEVRASPPGIRASLTSSVAFANATDTALLPCKKSDLQRDPVSSSSPEYPSGVRSLSHAAESSDAASAGRPPKKRRCTPYNNYVMPWASHYKKTCSNGICIERDVKRNSGLVQNQRDTKMRLNSESDNWQQSAANLCWDESLEDEQLYVQMVQHYESDSLNAISPVDYSKSTETDVLLPTDGSSHTRLLPADWQAAERASLQRPTQEMQEHNVSAFHGLVISEDGSLPESASLQLRRNELFFNVDQRERNARIAALFDSIAAPLGAKIPSFLARTKILKLKKSNVHGWGVFAGEPIYRDEFIVEYSSSMVNDALANFREWQYMQSLGGKTYFFKLKNSLIVDATHSGGITRFINHSCTPNCRTQDVSSEGADEAGAQCHLGLYALCDIAVGEELFYDYSLSEGALGNEPCRCGAPICKGFM